MCFLSFKFQVSTIAYWFLHQLSIIFFLMHLTKQWLSIFFNDVAIIFIIKKLHASKPHHPLHPNLSPLIFTALNLLLSLEPVAAPPLCQGGHRITLTCKKCIYIVVKLLNTLTWESQKVGFNKNKSNTKSVTFFTTNHTQ